MSGSGHEILYLSPWKFASDRRFYPRLPGYVFSLIVPAGMLPNAISTFDQGLPAAYFPNTGCDIKKYFGPHHIIINLTLCKFVCRAQILHVVDIVSQAEIGREMFFRNQVARELASVSTLIYPMYHSDPLTVKP